MKLSFVVPCYNGADTLQKCVESVFCQGIDDYEIIVVNDGSTDNTLEVAKIIANEHPQVVVLNKPNGGVSSARNMGIENATGDYILFLDADDEFDPNFWKDVKPYADKQIELILFGFDSEQSPSKVKKYCNRIRKDIVVDYLAGRVHIHICSILTRRDVIFDNVIRFDEGTYFSEDREFIIRVLMSIRRYEFVNINLFHYKYRENSAMHVRQYNYRKSTSLDAMARVLDLVKVNEARKEAALVQMNLTILLHLRLFRDTHCDDPLLRAKLNEFCKQYLTQKTPIRLNKYYLFVWFFARAMNCEL